MKNTQTNVKPAPLFVRVPQLMTSRQLCEQNGSNTSQNYIIDHKLIPKIGRNREVLGFNYSR